MKYSYASHLRCSRCSEQTDLKKVANSCHCGGPLLVEYDLDAIKVAVQRDQLRDRPFDLWRYHELLPVQSEHSRVSLGEQVTPLIELPRLGRLLGVRWLAVKDEGSLPTGTFKARGAAVGVSRAVELGVSRLSMPTNGNAGAAWSAYGARAGIEVLIGMPSDAPIINRAECAVTGASLFLVDGLIGDAARILRAAASVGGYFDASTLREPYRIEGKKTMALELMEQLDWTLPDVIVCPTGGGVGVIGMYKAMLECKALGWLTGHLPRVVAVQATGCAPIVRAFELGHAESQPWAEASTVAFGITVPKALGDFLVLEAIRMTGGRAVAVDDVAILGAQADLAEKEGLFVCPEGAAGLAAIGPLRASGWLQPEDRVVVINTGAGVKYPACIAANPPTVGRDAGFADVRVALNLRA
ncbi:MAG: threonine synthase [Candidatus Dormibacteraeota bacterium]|nr:threonine synthase [Candidatus Dormibacteraeota bacterium]